MRLTDKQLLQVDARVREWIRKERKKLRKAGCVCLGSNGPCQEPQWRLPNGVVIGQSFARMWLTQQEGKSDADATAPN